MRAILPESRVFVNTLSRLLHRGKEPYPLVLEARLRDPRVLRKCCEGTWGVMREAAKQLLTLPLCAHGQLQPLGQQTLAETGTHVVTQVEPLRDVEADRPE